MTDSRTPIAPLASRFRLLVPIVTAGAVGLVAATFVSQSAHAQAAVAVAAPTISSRPERTIVVSAKAAVRVVPDRATITLGVVTRDDNVATAQQKNDRTVRAVVAALEKAGVPRTAISPGTFVIDETVVDDRSTSDRSYKSAYGVTTQVTVTITDLKRVGDTLRDGVDAGANRANVEFGTTALRHVRDQARAAAINAAREKAATWRLPPGSSLERCGPSPSRVVGGAPTARRTRCGLTAQLVGSHLLVIAIATGISTFGLLSLARQYFVNADRQSLLVQARLLAQSCDQTCLDKRLSNADISRAQLPPASNAVQSRAEHRDSARMVVPDTVAQSASSANRGGLRRGQNVRTALTSVVRIVRLDDADPGPSATEAFSGTSSARQIAGMLVAAPVRLNGTVAGAVVVTQELADSHAIINDLRRRSLLAGAVASVIAPSSRCYVRGRSPDR